MSSLSSVRVGAPLAGPGWHRAAELVDIRVIPGRYGNEALQFVFRTAAGLECMRTTGTSLRPNSALGRLAEQLTGRPLIVDEDVDLAGFVGRFFDVQLVATTGGGGAFLSKVEPVAAPQAAAAAAVACGIE